MFQSIILGAIQGVSEWLPISSGGLIVLVQVNFFDSTVSLNEMLRLALFLHMGTFLAALIYFWKDVVKLVGAFFHMGKHHDEEIHKLMQFYLIATLITGVMGFGIILLLDEFADQLEVTGRSITIGVGALLLITASTLITRKDKGARGIKDFTPLDGVILGVVQGFALLPGLSRSGLTVSALLLRNIKNSASLRVSFLMSLPVVLGGNILFHVRDFSIQPVHLLGLLTAFVFGFATIHLLIKFAKRAKFGWFVFVFGILTIFSAFI